MSTTRWIPKWKIIQITSENKNVEVCFDEVSQLYACPICTPICKKGGIPDYGAYFFTIDDLKDHLEAHKESLWNKKSREEEEEEDEKVRVEEEEEEDESQE
ncbi:hypothetical protein [Stygiolobus caldivivus]|uniref:Uncharacterized protein n=1 Tax=Stygiolobus caldivivus TaxID=2824673 RepID=A0A8D5U863_9CREN|nr:hypothetical protein [Stygiolobus caldivivus]BCU70524.1 hypothetical protein KN1_18210 [Stygiolobus caldivivus]